MTLALPTRRDEAWRYSDHDAVARLWPVGPARHIDVAAGQTATETLLADSGGIRDLVITLGARARLDLTLLDTGDAYSRTAITVEMGEAAHFELGGALLARGTRTVELVTELRHVAPSASSNQTVRIVVGERATGSYLGKVAVARAAQHTDATQSAKALLLDRTATANLKPELEIYADDVKCAHGATVGELDRQAMFYLTSRGIDPVTARALLTEAFIADALADEALRERAVAWFRQ
jgi:Fe-S cluster assembly protein SufD